MAQKIISASQQKWHKKLSQQTKAEYRVNIKSQDKISPARRVVREIEDSVILFWKIYIKFQTAI